MIITFTKKIAAGLDFYPEFYFNRILMASGIRFHISVVDKNGALHHFNMKEDWGKWKIVDGPHPPDWIMELESQLNQVICQGMLS